MTTEVSVAELMEAGNPAPIEYVRMFGFTCSHYDGRDPRIWYQRFEDMPNGHSGCVGYRVFFRTDAVLKLEVVHDYVD